MRVQGIPIKNSIFLRLFITFIIIMLPMVIVGYTIYSWGISSIKEEISGSMHNNASYFLQNLEEEVIRIYLLQTDLPENTSMKALTNLNSNQYEYVTNVERVMETMYTIRTSSRYIEEVKIILPLEGQTFTDTEVGPYIFNSTEEDVELQENFLSDPKLRVNFWDESYYLISSYPATSKDDVLPPKFIVSVKLSQERLIEDLRLNFNSDHANSFLYSLAHHKMIEGSDNQTISNQIKECIIMGKQCTLDTEKAKPSEEGTFSMEVEGTQYLVASTKSDFLDFVYVSYTPENIVFSKLENYRTLIWSFFIIALLFMAFYSLLAYRFVHRPLSRLIIAFNRLQKGDMDVHIKHGYKGEFRYIFESFNLMTNNLKSLIDHSYKQKILVQKAELKQLQSQINPHFLYNSFFILHRRIKNGDVENAVEFSQQLGNYLQFITRSSSDEVQLFREVEHARIYADIQAMRFSNRIRLTFDTLSPKYINIIVPRLILQPIIENAFEYGLEDKEENGLLKVHFEEEDNILHIIVEDNGRKLKDDELQVMRAALESNDETTETTGMINIHKRLRLKFGSRSGLRLSHGYNGGLKVVLCIEIGGDKNDL